MVKKASINFETSLAELERVVLALEMGNTPLDLALATYQKGIVLLRQCQETLTAADQRIHVLEHGVLTEIQPSATLSTGDAE